MRKYTMTPLPNGPFTGLDAISRLCYGIILDRVKLSTMRRDSHFFDEGMNTFYALYRQRDLAYELGVSERTVRRCLQELGERELIHWVKFGYQGASRFYLMPAGIEYLSAQENQ